MMNNSMFLKLSIDDFREELEVASDSMSLTLDIPQFPKEGRSRGISLQIYGKVADALPVV